MTETMTRPRKAQLSTSTRKLSNNGVDFIDESTINGYLTNSAGNDAERLEAIIAKSHAKQALNLEETSFLINTDQPELVEKIFEAARQLKRDVYGRRIVLFAPLYVGSRCINDCSYCSFRRSNPTATRRTLSEPELKQQVSCLLDEGHKRLIMVYGEHAAYDADFIAETVRQAYSVQKGLDSIRRININAAPLDTEGFKKVHAAGIGTYQIFMETYHHETYGRVHPQNTRKGDYLYRLDALNRAYEAGCDDVGIGALFGLYDWRFDVMGLVQHALFLQEKYGCGPHTISFPRLRPASGAETDSEYTVNDYDFKRLIAILRLAVPYTGLILTARESAELRKEILEFGVSQIDAGSKIEIGGYTELSDGQTLKRGQFELGDHRCLDQVVSDLMGQGNVPSFCTACYRVGRTGEQFMEFAIPGFIEKFCTPNALLSLTEYLHDHASPETLQQGKKLVEKELETIENKVLRDKLMDWVKKIQTTPERDFFL